MIVSGSLAAQIADRIFGLLLDDGTKPGEPAGYWHVSVPYKVGDGCYGITLSKDGVTQATIRIADKP